MIENLSIKNFTVFEDLKINFSSKINIIIGENGVGKSQLLKLIFALCKANKNNIGYINYTNSMLEEDITNILLDTFLPIENKLWKLRKNNAKEKVKIKSEFIFGKSVEFDFNINSKKINITSNNHYERYSYSPIFIQTKEILSLLNAFANIKNNEQIIKLFFDNTYIDLYKNLIKEISINDKKNPKYTSIIQKIIEVTGGRFCFTDNKFYFEPGKIEEKFVLKGTQNRPHNITDDFFVPKKGCEISNTMMAEGFRKIGTLQHLLENGSLLPGVSGPLLWDEPESNMNPKLIRALVEILIELSRNGQQIIISTHDYVLLKWFDLLSEIDKDDHIIFHILTRNNEGEITIESTDNYNNISNNAISQTYSDLYDEEIARSLGRRC
jgi:predicted ATPase